MASGLLACKGYCCLHEQHLTMAMPSAIIPAMPKGRPCKSNGVNIRQFDGSCKPGLAQIQSQGALFPVTMPLISTCVRSSMPLPLAAGPGNQTCEAVRRHAQVIIKAQNYNELPSARSKPSPTSQRAPGFRKQYRAAASEATVSKRRSPRRTSYARGPMSRLQAGKKVYR